MSQFYVNASGGGPPGDVVGLIPDFGPTVVADGSGDINLIGAALNVANSIPDNNLATYNSGTSAMQFGFRYQGSGTTIGATTATLIVIPLVSVTTLAVNVTIAGMAPAIPAGLGGSVDALVFRGAGGATFVAQANKYKAESDPLLITSDINVTTSGNSLVVTATGVAGLTIEWYGIAISVKKTFV